MVGSEEVGLEEKDHQVQEPDDRPTVSHKSGSQASSDTMVIITFVVSSSSWEKSQ